MDRAFFLIIGPLESFSSNSYVFALATWALFIASRPGLRTFTRSSNVFTSEPEPGPTRGTRFRVLSCCERARCRRRRGRLIDLVEGETPTSRQSKRVPCRFTATRMFRFVPVGRFRKISARNYSSHQEFTKKCILAFLFAA